MYEWKTKKVNRKMRLNLKMKLRSCISIDSVLSLALSLSVSVCLSRYPNILYLIKFHSHFAPVFCLTGAFTTKKVVDVFGLYCKIPCSSIILYSDRSMKNTNDSSLLHTLALLFSPRSLPFYTYSIYFFRVSCISLLIIFL